MRRVLRAPKGSLDGFRRKLHNARERGWERSLKSRGTFSTLLKGDISTLPRQSDLRSCDLRLKRAAKSEHSMFIKDQQVSVREDRNGEAQNKITLRRLKT